MIPPGYDCVVLGDIERTRLDDIRVLFFAGVNDGIIPKAAAAGGILSGFDREHLLEKDIQLAPTPRERALCCLFLCAFSAIRLRAQRTPDAGFYTGRFR